MSSGGVLERPPRPEPTRISPYFFEQLTPLLSTPTRTATDAAERAVESKFLPVGDGSAALSPFTDLLHLFEPNPSGPHRDRAGVPAPIFAAAAPLSSAQHEDVQKGRLQRQALQEALWSSFTPPTYTAAFTDLIVEESDVTEKLRRAVSAAWAGVEKVTQRNAERRARFAALTAEEAPWRSEVQAKVYWQAADIIARYGLEVGGPTGTEEGGGDGGAAAKGEDDDEHVLLDFSVLQQSELGAARLSPSSSTAAAAAADHQAGGAAAGQRAKAWTTSTEELLDPCARDYPLRRIFAPLQRDRPSLPKWTTLLLEETQRVQKAQLPDLEARLRASVLFKVPLHRPFQAARAALQVCATQQRTAPSVEEGQVTAFRQVEQLSRRLDAFVEVQQAKMKTASEDGAAAAASSPAAEDTDDVAEAGERWATAEALWTMLLTELDGCKRFLADAVPRCTTLRDTIQQEQASVQAALMRHRSSCEDTFTRMKAEAQTCAELLTRNSERTLTAVAEMEEKFSPDEARLSAAISHRKAELVQLEGQQEKNVRRLREAVKACFVDQMKYEEAAQALLQDQLSLAQLQVSHQQLRQAVQVRHEGAIESRRHAAELTRLLEDGDGVAHAFFTACDAHLRRIENDDYFIQCRLMDQCTVAIQQRCRCLHAIAALYDQRYIALDKRAGGSWQLQFLLSGEQDWAVANLADVRAEFAQLDQDWAVVRAMRAAMEMDAAELDALVHTAEWSAMQSTLLRLDAPAPLQRRLPTLRAHSANLSNPAAGRGPQAVRRLLTS